MTLHRVRKHWSFPPRLISIYVEVFNPAETAYDIAFELWRGGTRMWHSEVELVLATQSHNEHGTAFELPELESKTYTLVVLLNGATSFRMGVDFGFRVTL